MAIEIRLLKEEEAVQANDFHNHLSQGNRTLEQFRWEFFDCPEGKSIYIIAIDTDKNDKIVGTQCGIPLKMVDSRGNQIMTAKSEDTLVDPEYRKEGTYLKLISAFLKKCNEEGIKYVWGFSNNEGHNKVMRFNTDYSTMQGVFVLDIFKSYRTLSKLNPENTFIDHLKIFGLCLFSKIKAFKLLLQPGTLNNYEMKAVKGFDSVDLFQHSVDSSELYMFLSQRKEYLDWRLYNNPYPNNYHEFILSEGNNVMAHAVINRREEGHAYICQILLDKNLSMKLKVAFVKHLISILKKQEAFLIRINGVDSNIYNKEQIQILKSLGVIFINRGIKFGWKAMNAGDKNFEVKNVLLSRLYTQGTI